MVFFYPHIFLVYLVRATLKSHPGKTKTTSHPGFGRSDQGVPGGRGDGVGSSLCPHQKFP